MSDTVTILKGLTSRMLAGLRRAPTGERPEEPPVDSGESLVEVSFSHLGEVRPVRSVLPVELNKGSGVFYEPCNDCGYMHESASACPRCESRKTSGTEAVEYWRR